jgi:hypothetical protein
MEREIGVYHRPRHVENNIHKWQICHRRHTPS